MRVTLLCSLSLMGFLGLCGLRPSLRFLSFIVAMLLHLVKLCDICESRESREQRALNRMLIGFQKRHRCTNDMTHPKRMRRSFLKKVLRRAEVRSTTANVKILRHTKPAWTGLNAPKENSKEGNRGLPAYEKRVYSLEELLDRGFEVVQWDGKYV